VGGHNLLEPAALKLPVLTGPSDFNGPEIAAMLVESGAARRVGNAVELAAAVSELLADSLERQRIGAIARRAVEINRGSAQRLVKLIEAQSANALPVPPASPASPNP
jgi:3-deoxy-D-manno-octulosonic-acid transferase